MRDRGVGGEANKLIGVGDIYSQRCCWRRRTTRVQFIPVFSLFALWRKAERGGAREQKCVVLEKERGELCERRNRRRRRWKSDIHAEEEKRSQEKVVYAGQNKGVLREVEEGYTILHMGGEGRKWVLALAQDAVCHLHLLTAEALKEGAELKGMKMEGEVKEEERMMARGRAGRAVFKLSL